MRPLCAVHQAIVKNQPNQPLLEMPAHSRTPPSLKRRASEEAIAFDEASYVSELPSHGYAFPAAEQIIPPPLPSLATELAPEAMPSALKDSASKPVTQKPVTQKPQFDIAVWAAGGRIV